MELGQESRARESSDVPVVLTRLQVGYALALTKNVNFSVRTELNDIAPRLNTDDENRRFTVSSDLVGQITDVSSWSIGANLADTRATDAGIETREKRFGVQMSYRRELTRDWDMVAQYQHAIITSTDEDERRSNTISLGLERVFDTRF